MSSCARFKKNLCNAQFCWLAIKTSFLLIFYYSLSIGLTFYQRWFLQGFNYPLTVVLCHLVVKFLLAWLYRAVYECRTGIERPVVGWMNYFTRVLPAGAASGLDVGLSNWGLELITVSLYTMTKSTSIVFILGFALLFKLEKKSWSLLVIVAMISLGLFLFTYKATQFHLGGFLLVLTASLTSGLRWTLAQFVMQKSKLGLGNPVDMVYHIQPWMMVTLLPIAFAMEGISLASTYQAFRFERWSTLAHTVGSVLLGASIAFLMEVAEFLVVSITSSLTLSIAGIAKEVFTLVLAVRWNGDQMSGINVIGLMVCMAGIKFHVVNKVLNPPPPPSIEEEEDEEFSEEIQMPLLDSSKNIMVLDDALNDTTDEDEEDIIFSIVNRPGR